MFQTRVTSCAHVFLAAEDKIGWHAKPLPKDMADMVIKDLQSRVTNSSKHLYPPTPMEDSPPVSLRNIRMPSAPSYKAGEKVSVNERAHRPCLSGLLKQLNKEFLHRSQRGKHTGWHWPSWAATMNALWHLMGILTTWPSLRSSRMSIQTAMWSATLLNKTWYVHSQVTGILILSSLSLICWFDSLAVIIRERTVRVI